MQIDKPIAIAIMLFIILLLIFFLVAPEYRQFKILQQKVGEKQAEYDAKFAYYSEVAKIYDQIMAKKDIVDKIDAAMPSEVSYGPLVYFFQKKGLENGIIVRGLSLVKASLANPDSDIKEISFSLDLLGGYRPFKSFLSSLEKSARLFEVNNVSFGTAVSPLQAPVSGGVPSKPQNQQQILQTYPYKIEVKTYSY